jgi:IS30 family transposase
MTIALVATMTDVREQLRRTWTGDRGKAFSAHVVFRVQTSIPVHFAEPNSPGSEGRSRTPTDCLARQYAPKRNRPPAMDRRGDPGGRRRALEHRPRKSLSWGTLPKPSTSTYGHSNDPVWQRVALQS